MPINQAKLALFSQTGAQGAPAVDGQLNFIMLCAFMLGIAPE